MLKSQKIVTVCEKCLTESCRQGIAPCTEHGTAGSITDTEENIAAMTPSDAEQIAERDGVIRLEIIGPFYDYRVTVGGYEVPMLRAVRVNGLISMTLDHRFGCDIPDDNRALPIIEFIAQAMAVGAGYSCFGENSKPINRYKCKLTSLDLSQVDDGETLHAEAEQ
jgi:hypothetical protein